MQENEALHAEEGVDSPVTPFAGSVRGQATQTNQEDQRGCQLSAAYRLK